MWSMVLKGKVNFTHIPLSTIMMMTLVILNLPVLSSMNKNCPHIYQCLYSMSKPQTVFIQSKWPNQSCITSTVINSK